MAVSMNSLEIDELPFEERLYLAEELWDSIASDAAAFPLTDAQRAELDRRVADHEAQPGTTIARAEVKDSLLEQLRRWCSR